MSLRRHLVYGYTTVYGRVLQQTKMCIGICCTVEHMHEEPITVFRLM